MIAILYSFWVIPLWIYCGWLLYVMAMGFYRAYLDNRLSGVTLYLAFPAVAIGLLMDWLSNWTIATLLFWELPKSPNELVTTRLSRYVYSDSGWRLKCAEWICHNLLDIFDPSGKHCKQIIP